MHRTILKSQTPINSVRQLARQNIPTGLFENPIEEMDIIVPDKGHLAEIWLKVKEQMKANTVIEKKKSYMEGKQASVEEARNEVAHEVDTMQSIISAFTEDTIHATAEFEHSLVELSIKIAEKIIKKKIEGEDDIIISVARNALKTVRESSEITILLNPSDHKILTQYEEFNSNENSKVNFVTDETIESGGCIIHSDWGVIDTQIDTQLKEVYTQLTSNTEIESIVNGDNVTE